MSDEHEHEEGETPPDPRAGTRMFLREIGNMDIVWEFKLIGGMTVKGRVLNFLHDPSFVPITILVMPTRANTVKPVDIPWHAIQTIKLERG
jgi:hypothetical protein